MDFSGTLSVTPGTLEAMLRDLVDSLVRHGFERVFIWTAHGGNVDALNELRERLAARSDSLDVSIFTDLEGVAKMQMAAVVAEGLDADHAGPHAGEYETSLVAALRSGSVRHVELAPGRVAKPEQAQGFF